MKREFRFILIVLVLIAALTACKSETTSDTATDTASTATDTGTMTDTATAPTETAPTASANPDNEFAMKAGSSGLAEVELGRMAAEKASNADVKAFGQKMVDDHSKANDELMSIATAKGITLPTEPNAEHKAVRDRLTPLTGAEFDKQYMAAMVQEHTRDVAEFERQSTAGTDPELKAFAGKHLPHLQEHLKQAQEIAAKVGAPAAQ